MEIGVIIFPTDKAIQPIQLAKEVESRGFESLWFPEHSHIPCSRETPWGGMKNAPPLPEEYWRSHDQFVALAACAAATTKLRVGTGITLVAQRDPIWLAKEIASLDMIPTVASILVSAMAGTSKKCVTTSWTSPSVATFCASTSCS